MPTKIDAPFPDGYLPKQPFWTWQQRECFDRSLFEPAFFESMEPRTGKSKIVVDKAAYHSERPHSPLHMTAVLIVGWPNGAVPGWIKDAFTENMPDRLKWKGFVWHANLAQRKWYKEDFVRLGNFNGLAVLAINSEALVSPTTRKAIDWFLCRRGRVAFVADESTFMCSANTRAAKIMYGLSQRPEVIWKHCLDGTPAADQGPLDLFTQYRWLNPAILGMTTNTEFKAKYAEYEIKLNHRTMKTYPSLMGYRNIDDLHARINPITYRARFEDCFNTPRKLYENHYFEITEQQRDMYTNLVENMQATFAGQTMTVAHAMTRVTRLQQITSNIFPAIKQGALHEDCDGLGCEECDGGVVWSHTLPKRLGNLNPRLEALREKLKPGRPLIVWFKFDLDGEDIAALAREVGVDAVRYDGTVSADEKEEAKSAFQSGRAGLFYAKERSAGRGIPLWKAWGHVYYSYGFSLRDRLQSEDRAEIKHRTESTVVINLVAEDTVDDNSILPALRAKMDVAAYIMQDPQRKWF